MFRYLLVYKHTAIYVACALAIFFQPAIAQAEQLRDSQSPKVNLANAGKFNYSSDVGIVAVDFNPSVLIINNACLKAGSQIVLVFPEIPQKIAEATILRKAKQPKGPDPKWTIEPGQSAYIVKLLHYTVEYPSLAIGILSSKSLFQIHKDRVYANLDGDGFKNTFRIAYSGEGAHPTVWSGQPLVSKRKWHGHFHLNYEVDPDATPKDY